jgi:hypothetical protein
MLHKCYKGVTRVLQGCYKCVDLGQVEGLPTVGQHNTGSHQIHHLLRCYKDFTRVLQEFYKSVTRVLRGCYEGVAKHQ